MARSLTVLHEENPSTSRLFNVFLFIAAAWLAATALAMGASEPIAQTTVSASP